MEGLALLRIVPATAVHFAIFCMRIIDAALRLIHQTPWRVALLESVDLDPDRAVEFDHVVEPVVQGHVVAYAVC